jgi:hypothetical protein
MVLITMKNWRKTEEDNDEVIKQLNLIMINNSKMMNKEDIPILVESEKSSDETRLNCIVKTLNRTWKTL